MTALPPSFVRPNAPSRLPGRRAPRQRGNALIFAMLGLVVSAIAALGVMQANRVRAKHDAGAGEASVLDSLRNATNTAILEQLPALQAGQPMSKNGVEVRAVKVDGVPTWHPTVLDLVGMGYLPPQWVLTRSTLNNARYTVSFHQTPDDCVDAACDIDGQVLISGPLRDGRAGDAAASDSAVIGPILTRLGVDAGVSLATSPTLITGYGQSWTTSNPVTGQPAGVVAVRVGTLAAAWSQFVRIGDTRDPNLKGNLTVAGDTVFGAAGGAHDSTVNGTLRIQDHTGAACVVMRPGGMLDVRCDGRLQAVTGDFTDASGKTTHIASTSVDTAGRVTAADSFETPTVSAFAADDPGAIVVKTGDLLIRDATGKWLLKVATDGTVSGSRDIAATRNLVGQRLAFSAVVAEGSACDAGQVASLADGGLATCQLSKFKALGRYGVKGQSCSTEGATATDTASGETLICRSRVFASVGGLLSNKVLMATYAVIDGSIIDASTAIPSGCFAKPGGYAEIFLMPVSDAENVGNTYLNRIATWSTGAWQVSLKDGNGIPTSSTAIAYIYCDYN